MSDTFNLDANILNKILATTKKLVAHYHNQVGFIPES